MVKHRRCIFLFENAPTTKLMHIGHQLRLIQKPDNIVTWQIDRNVNISNACITNCKFYNFYRKLGHKEVYITNIETLLKKKIQEFHYY